MILSHKHRFIFIKTNKTAGTSVEIGLSKFCGPQDVITPITPNDEAKRAELGYPGAQNYHARLSQYSPLQWAELLFMGRKGKRFYNHMPAIEVRDRVPAEVWNSYTKFCIERNPWDRVVSHYFWRNRTEPRPSLDSFLDKGKHLRLHRRGRRLYTIDGKLAVDRVIRFENLADELEQLRQDLGLPDPIDLPRAKSGHRSDKRHYRDMLTPEQRDRIAREFAFEIDTFGYEF